MMITAKDWNHSDYQHDSCVSFEQSKHENLGITELAWALNPRSLMLLWNQ